MHRFHLPIKQSLLPGTSARMKKVRGAGRVGISKPRAAALAIASGSPESSLYFSSNERGCVPL